MQYQCNLRSYKCDLIILLPTGASVRHAIPMGMDNAMLYVYDGAATVAGRSIAPQSVVVFDAGSDSERGFELTATSAGPVSAILFAGKRLKEPIAWHGPIVMNTQAEIDATFQELRQGAFPPKRVPWDYHVIAAKPKI